MPMECVVFAAPSPGRRDFRTQPERKSRRPPSPAKNAGEGENGTEQDIALDHR